MTLSDRCLDRGALLVTLAKNEMFSMLRILRFLELSQALAVR